MRDEISHRRVLKIAIPIVISNATVPILGAVDTGVVGQLGLAAPIGAVGIGAVIIGAIYWVFGFLRMGTSGMVAQARGAGDGAETGALLMRALIVALAAGVALLVLQVPLFWLIFRLSPASPEVEGMARTYLAIRVWGAPAAIGVYALSGWLIAHERTRDMLVLQLWMNGLNIGLDLWFVLGLGWGVGGVSVATIIAEWSGIALALFMCRSVFHGDQWRNWVRIFDRAKIRAMAGVSGNIMVRSVLLELSFILFMFVGAGIDDTTLAANQILIQFVSITAYGLDGFAIAAETLVGNALGAGSRQRLRRAALLTSGWAAAGSVLMALFFGLAGGWLVSVMATSIEVQRMAAVYLPWMVLAPVTGFASWMLDGIFIGATHTREMRNAMIQTTVVYALVLVLLVPLWGNHGLWASLLVSYVVRAYTLWRYYPNIEAAAQSKPVHTTR